MAVPVIDRRFSAIIILQIVLGGCPDARAVDISVDIDFSLQALKTPQGAFLVCFIKPALVRTLEERIDKHGRPRGLLERIGVGEELMPAAARPLAVSYGSAEILVEFEKAIPAGMQIRNCLEDLDKSQG